MATVHQVSALLLAFALVVANVGTCPGWAPTPEARMACCKKGGGCAMREGAAKGSAAGEELTQAQADGCCAASERDESDSSNPAALAATSNAVFGDAVVIDASAPALVLAQHSRTIVPLPTTPVPRHVLLSVFLV